MPEKTQKQARQSFPLLDELAKEPWAILPNSLRALAGLATSKYREDYLIVDQGSYYWEAEFARLEAGEVKAQSDSGRIEGGIAVLPITGVISQRFGWFSDTSTDRVGESFDRLVAAPHVQSIVLEIDSPGGSVYGIPELAEKIFSARGTKPIVAVANSLAASGAYWIGSAADELVVAPGGQVGSIGTFILHADFSRALEEAGIKLSFVQAGRYKTEGNEYEPLDDEARAELQRLVDGYYADFVAAVAKHRGVSAAAVKRDFGEGRMFRSADAVAAGLADRVGTMDEVLKTLGVRRPRAAGRAAALRKREIELKQLGLP